MTEPLIRIAEQDGTSAHIVAETSEGRVEIMAEMERDAERLILRNLHIEGPGPGALGRRLLYDLARALGRKQGAASVVVYGGRRTTGARPGPHAASYRNRGTMT